MSGNSRKAAIWIMGSGITFAGGYLISSVSSGHKTPTWPYFLFGIVFLFGVLLWSIQRVSMLLRSAWRRVRMSLSSVLPRSKYEPKRDGDPTPNGTDLESVAVYRWRCISEASDVHPLAKIGNEGFSHASYLRQGQNKPPVMRVGAFVACSPLGDKEPTEADLQTRFQALLQGGPVMSLIGLVTYKGAARWQSQPEGGRLRLESDLCGQGASAVPVASAMLRLPSTNGGGAELVLHIDLPMNGSVPVKAKADRWYERFTAALAVPAELTRFLRDLGLTTADDPTVRFAIQVQPRTAVSTGIDEIVDTTLHPALTPATHSPQFHGWAVADPAGYTAKTVSQDFLEELYRAAGRKLNQILIFSTTSK
jgi:hypothetical protein